MKTKTSILSLLLAGLASAASPLTYETTVDGAYPASNVTGKINTGPKTVYLSGVIQFLSEFGPFDSFCVEPDTTMHIGQTITYTEGDPSNVQNYTLISQVVGGYLVSSMDSDQAAGVQWAIWELLSETSNNTFTLNSGSVSISPQDIFIRNIANAYLDNVSTFDSVDLLYLKSDVGQDIISWNINVPEPSSFILLGLTSIGFLTKRARV